MVFFMTRLFVADVSGARLTQCLKILGASNRLTAMPGDNVIVVVKRALPGTLRCVEVEFVVRC